MLDFDRGAQHSEPTMQPSLQPTLRLENRCGLTWDQTKLPFAWHPLRLANAHACVHAIAAMQVRGAPLIGAVAALGMAFALEEACARAPDTLVSAALLDACAAPLLAARPTAVNLAWAVARVRRAVEASLGPGTRSPEHTARAIDSAWAEVEWLLEADIRVNQAIGRYGVEVLLQAQRPNAPRGRALQILTHCNAGSLATVAWGTATAPIYMLHARGLAVHVWVDETRPRNQGASLTACELAAAGIPHTVIADNAGGLLMMRGEVDAVIVGCDRVCANGDVINKVGTYLKALAAHAHSIPFWVACPSSSIDRDTPHGLAVEIEERSGRELTHVRGLPDLSQPLAQPLATAPPAAPPAAPTLSSGMALSVTAAKSIQPLEPIQPNEPIQPIEPIQPNGPIQPVAPNRPTEPTEPTEPVELRIMREGQRTHNPGFDNTPARWVSGLITEFGVYAAHQALAVLDAAARAR